MYRRAVLTIEGQVGWLSAPFPRPDTRYRRVKADYLFSYQPPINLIALLIMLPASWVLSPRWFHKVRGASLLLSVDKLMKLQINVFMIRFLMSACVLSFRDWQESRLTSFPILLFIAYYERQAKHIQATTFTETVTATAERVMETLPRSVKRLSRGPFSCWQYMLLKCL